MRLLRKQPKPNNRPPHTQIPKRQRLLGKPRNRLPKVQLQKGRPIPRTSRHGTQPPTLPTQLRNVPQQILRLRPRRLETLPIHGLTPTSSKPPLHNLSSCIKTPKHTQRERPLRDVSPPRVGNSLANKPLTTKNTTPINPPFPVVQISQIPYLVSLTTNQYEYS